MLPAEALLPKPFGAMELARRVRTLLDAAGTVAGTGHQRSAGAPAGVVSTPGVGDLERAWRRFSDPVVVASR